MTERHHANDRETRSPAICEQYAGKSLPKG
jgi:hypothetical protein